MNPRRFHFIGVIAISVAFFSIIQFSLFHTTRVSSANSLTPRLSPLSSPGVSSPVATSGGPVLQGKEAISHLKQEGSYDSLAEAMAIARYSVNWVDSPRLLKLGTGAYEAPNPVQGFTTYFTPEGMHLVQGVAGQSEWSLELKLNGVGYDNQMREVTAGTPKVQTNRIELERTSSFTEWYVNGPEGLEQGMTVESAPGGKVENQWLRVVFDLDGTLQPRLANYGQTIHFFNLNGDLVLSYDKLIVTDTQGKPLAARMGLEHGQMALEIDDSKAVYPLTIDPLFSQQSKLVASDGAADDLFGVSVAVNGDTAVVGASLDDVGANSNQGSAYVFVRSGTTWSQQQKLTASDGAASDEFGGSVGINGNTVVVGARLGPGSANANQGAAYVFVRSGTIWSQQTKLIASDGAGSDNFGISVGISGETVVVGADSDDISGATNRGSVYVYVRSGSTWSQQQKLTASDGVASDQFGISVAISGESVVVGAFHDTVDSTFQQGSAYVFVRSGTTWSQEQKLTPSNGAASDQFGVSVGIDGDTVVVGANLTGTANRGTAYVYVRLGAIWSEQQILSPSDGGSFDFFGASVAISGDKAVVGSASHDVGSNGGQGTAYVYVRNGATWSEQQELIATDGTAGDGLGSAVAISGATIVAGAIGVNSSQGAAYVFACSFPTWIQQTNFSSDDGGQSDHLGYSAAISGDTVVVGALYHDIGANHDQGAAYVFVRSGTTWIQQQKLTAPDGSDQDLFGFSVAIDVNTIVVGSLQSDIGPNMEQGAAYVFVRSGTTWSLQQKLTASDGATGDFFGSSVAIDEDTVVVAAAGDDQSQGAAYVFVRSGTTWSQQQKLTAGDGAMNDNFGGDVALSGDTAVVTAANDNVGANPRQGSAYVFVRSGTTWSQQQKLTASDGAASDFFGTSAAVSGNTAVIGASVDDVGANNSQGSAYVFVRSGTTWSQQQQLTLQNGMANDQFGNSVAMSGETIVVGAYLFDSIDKGAAFVFVRSGTTWSLRQQVVPPFLESLAHFGASVGMSGETIVVGADQVNVFVPPSTFNNDQGAAYTFVTDCVDCQTITGTVSLGGTICAGNSSTVRVTLSGGTPPYTVTLDNGGGTLTGNSPLNFTVSPGSTTTYAVQSGTDSLGCPVTGSGSATVTVNPAATVNAGPDQTVCASSPTVTLAGTRGGSATASTWSGGSGTFNPSNTSLTPTYTPTAGEISSGSVTLTLTTNNPAGPCNAVSDSMTITINPAATVNAGPDQTICAGSMATLAGSRGGSATSSTWSGGGGTFTPNNTSLTPTYTPTAGEIAAGTLTLTLTTNDPTSPCPAVSDTVTITITPGPTVNAGPDQTVCASSPNATLSGSFGNGASSATWSGGSGTFNPNTTTLNAVYTPSAGEIAAGSVTVTLTTDDPAGPCNASSDTVTITINPAATVNAGPDQSTCAGTGATLAGSVGGGASTGTWSGGSGTFTPNNITLNAVYTPGAGEISAGSVTLTLTTNDPTGPCGAVADTVTITIMPGPTVNAGLDQTICAGSVVMLSAVVGGSSTNGTWSGGAGSFNPDPTSPTVVYTPTGSEVSNGMVTLTYTTNAGGGCPAASDSLTILINPMATVSAGPDQTICAGSAATLAGSRGGSATSATWSGGSGTFSPNNSTLNAIYTPSTAERAAGTVTLTLTTNDPTGPCSAVSDTMTIIIDQAPTANAGPDQQVCLPASTPIQLAASFGGSASNGTWSGGAGVFANASDPNTTYTPDVSEQVEGTVVTLTFTTNDPAGPCLADSDAMTITILNCTPRVQLMVADTTNNRIQGFNGTDWFVMGFGVGSGPGQFRQPEAVTFDSNNRIYVADTGNNRISFSTDGGTTWADLATNGTGLNQVKAPQGVALDVDGNLYVSDTGNGRVLRFAGGMPGLATVLATNGTASGQVRSPRGLVVDSTFRLFVTDQLNSRVLRIANANTTLSGTSGVAIATAGTALNKVFAPQGITIDESTGDLYVADTGNNRILKWRNANPTVAGSSAMALTGSGLGQVSAAEGVTVTQFVAGPYVGGPMLIVGDTGNNRIEGRFIPTGSWTLIGVPDGVGTGVGQFRSPSKIQ